MTDLSYLKIVDEKYDSSLGNVLGNLGGRLSDWFIQPRDSEITDLKLHIYGAETIQLNADITDNYVESNVAYQEHIALKPKVFTVSGEIGELTWYRNDKTESFIAAVEQKLSPIVSFGTPVSKNASAIQDKAMKIIGIVDSLDNFANRLWKLLSDEEVDTEQKKGYKYLMALWQRRVPINIKTPFGSLKNYVIQNVEFTQPERTEDKSQVKISFKEFRIVKEKVATFNKDKYMSRKASQMAKKQNKGKTTGVKLTENQCKPCSIYVDESAMVCRKVGSFGVSGSF